MPRRAQEKPLHLLSLSFKNCLLTRTESSLLFSLQRGKRNLLLYAVLDTDVHPVSELAFQISEQFAVLGAPLSIRTSVIVGGMDMMTQALELDGRPHVVIATPGRIVDHLKSSSGDWDLSRIKFLVSHFRFPLQVSLCRGPNRSSTKRTVY